MCTGVVVKLRWWPLSVGDKAAVISSREDDAEVASESLDAFDEHGYARLSWAAYHGDAGKARKLLLAGADPNLAAKADGMTPLHHAAWAGHPDVAKLLLEHPQIDIKTHGELALAVAALPMDERRCDARVDTANRAHCGGSRHR